MTTTRATSIAGTADRVFLALGQTAYVSQLFEATMLEVLATANELLGGTGDGRTFQASLDAQRWQRKSEQRDKWKLRASGRAAKGLARRSF